MPKNIENEIQFEYIRSPGPGGQNVNKVATAVQLRFNIPTSNILSHRLKDRLLVLAKSHINQDGDLLITARRFRSQEQNRQDALNRFNALLEKARLPVRKRIKTRPTLASKIERIEQKKKHGLKKQRRGKIDQSFE